MLSLSLEDYGHNPDLTVEAFPCRLGADGCSPVPAR